MSNDSQMKPIIDPEWGARFSKDLERAAEQARQDAARVGEQMARILATFAEKAHRP